MLFTFFWLMIVLSVFIRSRGQIKSWQKFSIGIYKSIRFKHVAYALFGIFGVITITTSLWMTGNKILQFGWLITPLLNFSNKNLSDVQTDQPESLPVVSTVLVMSVLIVAGLVLLLSVLPQFAYNEEVSFRKPYMGETLWEQFKSCFVFGLLHLVMGIPVAAAIGLMFGGAVFMFVSQREFNKNWNPDVSEMPVDTESTHYNRYVRVYDEFQDKLEPHLGISPKVQQIYDEVEEHKNFYIEECKHIDNRENTTEAAIMESTRVHAIYNAILVSIMVMTYMLTVIGSSLTLMQ